MAAVEQSVSVDQYETLYREFRWQVPARFNIAEVCCRRWAADAGRIAVHYEDDQGHTETLTYAELQRQANRLSNLLRRLGVARGDRVAVVLAQRPQTAVTNMACFQLGAVAMPLSVLFGPDALEYRLQNSEACVAIADDAALASLGQIRAACPALRHLIAVDAEAGGADGALSWETEMAREAPEFDIEPTAASDPAILIYTSGTTGAPKGALLPHSAAIGNLPGFVASQDWFPQEGDVFWTPADWAWTGGLMDGLLPTLYFGMPLLGYRGRFAATTAFRLMEKYRVTNTFLFPTALKMMMKEYPQPRRHFDLKLRAIMSAGEAVGDTVFEWSRQALGITINEMFGQTEINYLVGNSAHRWPPKPGSMGRPYPGHRVAVLDDDGQPAGPNVVGEVALHRTDIHGTPDPIFFLEYWKNPQATADKYSGDWCRTGDLALIDDDGYYWYQGRADDMFKAAGYRIGPSEIENCLLKHPAVLNAAVVPKPDAERGNLVKAYVVLAPNTARDPAAQKKLVAELQAHVRGKLAPYEYPKEIEFIEELPMTTTGKLQRRVLRLREEERARAAR